VLHDSAERDNGLRAGVGQASMEETAECTAEAGEGYEAMGIWAPWIERVTATRFRNWADGDDEAQRIDAGALSRAAT
jgi:hypothetical protein